MSLEIERKWLLATKPTAQIGSLNPIKIVQGYLALHKDKTEVRIRQYGKEYWLAVKSSGNVARTEVEVSINESQYQELLPITTGRSLIKQRYCLKYEHYTIEIDEYLDNLEGIWVAEVEFNSLKEANEFVAPYWFGNEITGEVKYKNYILATEGKPSQS